MDALKFLHGRISVDARRLDEPELPDPACFVRERQNAHRLETM